MSDLPAGFTPVKDIPAGFTPVRDSAAPKAPTPKADNHGVIVGGVLDTLGMTDRPGAVPLTGNAQTKTPLGVVLKPEGIAEGAIREAVLAPLTAKSLPARLAITAGLGGAEQLASGKGLEAAGYGALLDAIVAGTMEGAMGAGRLAAGAVGTGARKLAREYLDGQDAAAAAKRGFEWATKAPSEALDALRARFPGAKVFIPSIDPKAKITLDEAVQSLSQMTGNAYKQARAEIAYWMNTLDKQKVPKPKAGQVFKASTSPERFTPPAAPQGRAIDRAAAGVAEGADKVVDVAGNKALRGAIDVAATTKDEDGRQVGLIPAAALADAAFTKVGNVGRYLGTLFQR